MRQFELTKKQLDMHQIACTMGGIAQYDVFSTVEWWSWGEIIELGNIQLVAWYNEWMDMIWVKRVQFHAYLDELEQMCIKLDELGI